MTTSEQRAWVKSMRAQVIVAGLRGMVPGAVLDKHVRHVFTRDLDELYDLAKGIQAALEPTVSGVHHADT